MAKIKWGLFVTDGRNKVGGHVLSKNRAGSYIRTKVTPVNPQTTAQSVVRNRLASISQAWRGLSQAARDAWNSAVANYTNTDIFGDLKTPSGFNLHEKLNLNRLNIGSAVLTTPPLPGSPAAITELSVTATAGTPSLTVTFDPAVGAANAYILRASAGLSPGKAFAKNQMRQIDVLLNADTSPVDALGAYVDVFGSIPAAGQRIYVELVPVLIASGQAGTSLKATAIVGA